MWSPLPRSAPWLRRSAAATASSRARSAARDHAAAAAAYPARRSAVSNASTGTLVFVGGEGGGQITGGLVRQVRPTLLSRFSRQRFATFWVADPNSSDLDALTGMIESGQVTPAVQRTRPLTDIVDVMVALERGAVSGKLVLVP
jgi:NADPH:quinone reductase-like Zn-dependent oxidoreductase